MLPLISLGFEIRCHGRQSYEFWLRKLRN